MVAFIIAIKFAAAFGFAHAARSVVEPTFGWKGVVTLSLISGTLGLLALGWVRRVSSRSKHAGPGTWLTRRLARFSRWSRTVGGHRFNLRRPDINNPRQLEHVLIRDRALRLVRDDASHPRAPVGQAGGPRGTGVAAAPGGD